ncbi:hypothetical protein AAHZ94_20520 [Streptomyces sp. HSW2009]|uniref:hypothetical protein n=1 Tax=Streptomyces sp. HSW2009 TaxID=3142890 RepID=UPI0032EDFEC5
MTTTESAPQRFYWRGLPVPFIAPWSVERPPSYDVIETYGPEGSRGIGYADELPLDRRRGVLWMRRGVKRGAGTPDLASVHPLRQRQAMSHLLCQVCGKSTFDADYTRWGKRHLVIARDVSGRPIEEGELTGSPPVCRPCAIESVRGCPHLRKGHVSALVERIEPWGVAGILYRPTAFHPLPAPPAYSLSKVAFTNPQIGWTLAARDLATLHGCTPIDLDELAA